MNYNNIARRVILQEASALHILAEHIAKNFGDIVDHILNFKGRVILTGMGKSGYIARKIAASFASTGTAAFYIHPAEASHGDLGMITDHDFVIMLSNSGETKELFDIVNYCKRFAIKTAAMTMKADSTIALNCDFLLAIPVIEEASAIIAPTTSSLMMLSLGDALTIAVQEARGISKDEFSIYHPGGKIGATFKKVSDLMRTSEQLPIVREYTTFIETIIVMTQKSLGCAVVMDSANIVVGIITDGDLRRHIHDMQSATCASDIMTKNPQVISSTRLAVEALQIMNDKAITSLVVIDDTTLMGIIHIHDLLRSGIN